MCFLISFMPATTFAVIGYFVLFSTSKIEGPTRKFGRILAIWVFIVAVLIPIGGAILTLSGNCPIDRLVQ